MSFKKSLDKPPNHGHERANLIPVEDLRFFNEIIRKKIESWVSLNLLHPEFASGFLERMSMVSESSGVFIPEEAAQDRLNTLKPIVALNYFLNEIIDNSSQILEEVSSSLETLGNDKVLDKNLIINIYKRTEELLDLIAGHFDKYKETLSAEFLALFPNGALDRLQLKKKYLNQKRLEYEKMDEDMLIEMYHVVTFQDIRDIIKDLINELRITKENLK